MNNTINLSPYKNKSKIHYEKAIKATRIISIILLFFVILSGSSIFVLNSTSSLPNIIHQQNAITTNLDFLRKRAILLYLIHDRTSAIQSIYSTRTSYEDIIRDIKTQTTNDISIDSLRIKKNSIDLSLSSDSLLSLDIFLNKITKIAQEKKYKTLTVSDLIGDGQQGKFSIAMIIDL